MLRRKFRVRLPVQFRDIDVAGHVNHATYLQYRETARVEFLRSIGRMDIFHPRIILEFAHCEYYRPIINDRRVTITVWISRIGNLSWDFDYTIGSPHSQLYAQGRTTQVSYNYEKRSSTHIMQDVRKRLGEHTAKPLKFKGKV